MSNDTQLPNPFTPMAFLPPDLAYQTTIATYVLLGSLSALIWDILNNLHSDIKMVASTHGRIRLPIIVYFISRFGSLSLLLSETIMLTSPVGHCENIRWIQILFLFSVPPTSFLFFFRVRALYLGNNLVTGFFSFMWLAVVGGCLTPILGVSGAYIGTTQYCIYSRLGPYVSAACIIPFVNDTLIFLATSWKLMQNAHVDPNIKNGVKIMVFGEYLPALSKGILQDGQAYFLTIITLNLVTAILFNNSAVPIAYRTFIGTPNVVLMNSMACHVFRKIRLGVYRESTMLPTINVVQEDRRGPLSAIAFHGEVASNTSGSTTVDVAELEKGDTFKRDRASSPFGAKFAGLGTA